MKGQQQTQSHHHTREAPQGHSARTIAEPQYMEEQRNLQDLGKAAFSVGTEWDRLDSVYKYDWDFTNLEHEFEQGGKSTSLVLLRLHLIISFSSGSNSDASSRCRLGRRPWRLGLGRFREGRGDSSDEADEDGLDPLQPSGGQRGVAIRKSIPV
ncbi:hypothetical protein M0R45_011570 [Rubus argutus]|uniref:Uncharacterized protein n=1 Tax=Rubus argutus TaxID=59490 RepID=A0AAW1YB73_RUBAR